MRRKRQPLSWLALEVDLLEVLQFEIFAHDSPQQILSNQSKKDRMHLLTLKQAYIGGYCTNLCKGISLGEGSEFEVDPFLEDLLPVSQFFRQSHFVLLKGYKLCLQCALRKRAGKILKTHINSPQDDYLMQKMTMGIEQQELFLHVTRTAKQLSLRAVEAAKIIPVDLHQTHLSYQYCNNIRNKSQTAKAIPPTAPELLLLDLVQQCLPYGAIVQYYPPYNSQRMLPTRNAQLSNTKTSFFPGQSHQPSSTAKGTFVGLTLKEYFNIADSKKPLEEIDEENNSEVSGGTPCFGGDNERQDRDKVYRRNRHKTELQQLIVENEKTNSNPKPTQRMVTLSLEELAHVDKNAVKLPSIHEQRQRNASRQGLKDAKQVKNVEKKEVRGRVEESVGLNLAVFLKKQQNAKCGLAKNMMNMRRGIRSRVTSTSFYHMNLRDKEKQRVRTEEQIDSGFEKSFVITRYGAMMSLGKNREDLAALKKYENSFKLTRH